MVDRSEAYVGIFAWRYGYIPTQAADRPAPARAAGRWSIAVARLGRNSPALKIPVVEGAVDGQTSITHYEYLRAVQRMLPVMAFLLDEHYPWPPQLIDGFDTTRAQAPANADKIRALRLSLQQEWVVSWFTTPTDLEARVSAAVTMAGLTCAPAQTCNLRNPHSLPRPVSPATALQNTESQSIMMLATSRCIENRSRHHLVVRAPLPYCDLAHRLTQARRILVVDTTRNVAATSAGAPPCGAAEPVEERFVGQLSTSAILTVIG